MAFNPKSGKQMNFLHALKGDQQKMGGPITPQAILSPPMASGMKPQIPAAPTMNPAMHTNPVPMVHMPQPAAPKFMPPSQPMGNANVPSLPSGQKLPKFGKMKNSLKGGPFNKSNKA